MKQVTRESVETTRETPKRTFTIEHKQNLSRSMKGRKPWNKGLTKDDPRVLKNIRATQANPHLRANLSKALMGHADTFRRKHTPEEIEKMRAAQKGRPHPYAVWNKGLTKATDPRLIRIGRSISQALLAKPEAWRKETSRVAKSHVIHTKVSKFEQAVIDEFRRQGMIVEQQHFIRCGDLCTFVDIYLATSRICVYIDGTYWHTLPETIERDARVNVALIAAGYKVRRFWGDNQTDIGSIVNTVRKMI